MPSPTVLDNDAALVVRIDDASVTASGDRPIAHGSAVLIGVRDGGGALRHRGGGEHRYFPVARGRVDWLGPGDVAALAGTGPFGEALLVEVRALSDAPGVSRTFGDKVLFRNESHGPAPRGAAATRGFGLEAGDGRVGGNRSAGRGSGRESVRLAPASNHEEATP